MSATLHSLLAVAMAQSAWADPPRSMVTLVVIDPASPPQPMPGPADQVQLDAGRFELLRLNGYVGKVAWRSSGPAVAVERLAPKSRVWFVPPVAGNTVEADGPVKIALGLKVGAAGPTRHDIGDEPSVMLRPGPAGEAVVEALGVDADGYPYTVLRITVRTGSVPQPQPTPGPQPDPAPPGPVNPAGPVAFLVVVEETADAVAGRGAFFADTALAARMKARGLRWRVVDKDVVGADGKPPADVVRFLTAAAGKPYPSLFLVDAAGKLIDQRPVPRTPVDLLALLTQFGG